IDLHVDRERCAGDRHALRLGCEPGRGLRLLRGQPARPRRWDRTGRGHRPGHRKRGRLPRGRGSVLMAGSDRVRGVVGQNLNGQKDRPAQFAATFVGGATSTWIVPYTSFYRFVQWGPGANAIGSGQPGGGSGGYCESVLPLVKGQAVTIAVGSVNSGIDTTV